MPIRWNKLLIVLSFLVANVSFSQEKNPTVYPYGGTLDSSRFENWMKKIPLNFQTANFDSAQFDNRADFGGALFLSSAHFTSTHFDSLAHFDSAQFDSLVFIRLAKFDRRAYFGSAQFDSKAYFGWAQFDSLADFREAQFHSLAEFSWVKFHSLADFREAQFDSLADFDWVQFDSRVNFSWAQFNSRAVFFMAKFDGRADFTRAQFNNRANFSWAQFNSGADFSEAQFDSLKDFERANIGGEFCIGSRNGQKFNFIRTIFSPQAKIILCEFAEIKIQAEKIQHIYLLDILTYSMKRAIIDNLKEKSFKDNPKAQFELEYIFEKSTMYQEKSDEYIKNIWYQILNYPKLFLNTLYYLTMGLGYRPFRLAWWVLGFIIGFGIFYFFKMRDSINGYILKKFEMKESSGTKRKKNINEVSTISRTESLMNCLYFSAMLLFSFRLKGEILTFFNLKEKRYIVGEYLLGLLIYIAFLTLAKSGSILHNLRSLFVG